METVCGILYLVVFVTFIKLLTSIGDVHESVDEQPDSASD